MVDSLIPGIFSSSPPTGQQQPQPQQASQQYAPSPYGMAAQMLSPLAGTNNNNNFMRQIAMAQALQKQQQGNQNWNQLNTLNQNGGSIMDANGNPIGPAAAGSYGGGTPLAGLNPPGAGSPGSSGGVSSPGAQPPIPPTGVTPGPGIQGMAGSPSGPLATPPPGQDASWMSGLFGGNFGA